MKPIEVREKLLKNNLKIFTPQIFGQVFNASPTTVKYFLESQTKAGFFLRLKRGVYTLKTDVPSEEEIANTLYKPSYISFEYALAYYGVLTEMPYTVTSATTKPTRKFSVNHTFFSYRTIMVKAYSGYSLIRGNDSSFYMAELEKAVADYLYFVSLKKSSLNERLFAEAKKAVDKQKLIKYLSLFNTKALTNLARKTLL
jgi:predicted transcriptional regulator of viral defense system